MNRIHRGYGDSIVAALDILPVGMRERVDGVHFWTEVDPGWAGFVPGWQSEHRYAPGFKTQAACCYPWHTADKSLTIVVLEDWLSPAAIVHELGHALQFRAGLRDYQAVPVSDYAHNSRFEAFAESLTAWLFWSYGDEGALASDSETLALFDRLSEPVQ